MQQQGKRILLVSLVFLTVGGLVFWASSGFSRERLHKGQPISSWVDRACASYGELEIRQELLEIGPEVVPHLTGKLRIQDTWIRRGWIAFRNKLPSGLQGILPEVQPAISAHCGAAECLGLFGAEARPAVLALTRMATARGEEADRAITALGSIGPVAEAALPTLHGVLKSQNSFDQVTTAWAIWNIGRETNLALEVFTKAITQTNEDAAVNGALALSRMATAAQPAVSALVQLLSDRRRSVDARGNAAIALGATGLTNEMVVSTLMNGTRNQELHVRMDCIRALWQMGGRYTNLAVSRIIEWYAQHPEQKWDFRMLQRYLGLDIQAAIPVLKELLESEAPEIRQAANDALEQIRSQ